jgi:hypothetical protein
LVSEIVLRDLVSICVFNQEIQRSWAQVNAAPSEVQQVLVRVLPWNDTQINQRVRCVIHVYQAVIDDLNGLLFLVKIIGLEISSLYAISPISAVLTKVLCIIELWESFESWHYKGSCEPDP